MKVESKPSVMLFLGGALPRLAASVVRCIADCPWGMIIRETAFGVRGASRKAHLCRYTGRAVSQLG